MMVQIMQADILGMIHELFSQLQKAVTINIYPIETRFFNTSSILRLPTLIHTSIILSILPHLCTIKFLTISTTGPLSSALIPLPLISSAPTLSWGT